MPVHVQPALGADRLGLGNHTGILDGAPGRRLASYRRLGPAPPEVVDARPAEPGRAWVVLAREGLILACRNQDDREAKLEADDTCSRQSPEQARWGRA
mgnify:CR=1 FL=1